MPVHFAQVLDREKLRSRLSTWCVVARFLSKNLFDVSYIDEAEFMLQDPAAESQFGFRLKDSIRRAQARKLLDGKYVYATAGVKPDSDTLREIVECADGKLLTKLPPKGKRPPAADVLLISCKEDLEEAQKLSATFDPPLQVYDAELLLSGLLKQDLEYDRHRLSI